MNVKDRMRLFLEHLGIGQKKFEQSVNLSNGFVNNIGDGISTTSLNKITSIYPDLNTAWLLNGVGEMLNDNNKPYHQKRQEKKLIDKNPNEIVFTNADFSAGTSIEFFDDTQMIQSAYTMDIPEFKGTVAFRAYGDSMEPTIKSGSIVFATKIEYWNSHLEYGQVYGIVCTDNRRYLKYIRKSKKQDTHFLLKSENEFYDDFELPKDKIKNIWLIHGWLNKRT